MSEEVLEEEVESIPTILEDVKKMIGPSEIYDHFNTDLIIHINSVFNILQQMGVGPEEGFSITADGKETWDDYIEGIENKNIFQMVKSYMYLKVRMQFDPPTGSVLTYFQDQIKEYEWRLNVASETKWSNKT